ncbi:MAG TPA: helix-turn-helix transcriptional regulator [Armatimonadota bacterium]|jgi:transcriptional regulator with XRE-family HTH domain
MAFGKVIAAARKAKLLSQKDLAARLMKDDGKPISPQYLNDIEHDRRNPPSEDLLRQIAVLLDLDVEYLCFLAGQLPSDIRDIAVDQGQVREAFKAFRRSLGDDHH